MSPPFENRPPACGTAPCPGWLSHFKRCSRQRIPFCPLSLPQNLTYTCFAIIRICLGASLAMNQRPFTILIVSPDRLTLRRLSKFLEVFGYDVRQARDATQALAAAETARPDFLIVDGTQGNATGLQLGQEIRRGGLAHCLYALLLVQQPEVSEIAAALEQGFDDFLAAPIVFGELLARLRAG